MTLSDSLLTPLFQRGEPLRPSLTNCALPINQLLDTGGVFRGILQHPKNIEYRMSNKASGSASLRLRENRRMMKCSLHCCPKSLCPYLQVTHLRDRLVSSSCPCAVSVEDREGCIPLFSSADTDYGHGSRKSQTRCSKWLKGFDLCPDADLGHEWLEARNQLPRTSLLQPPPSPQIAEKSRFKTLSLFVHFHTPKIGNDPPFP